MTIAYWCVFGMILYPLLFTALAKSTRAYHHREPRVSLPNLVGWRKRAYWIELNSYESFSPFAVAVIIAHQLHAFQPTIDKLAVGFVIARVLHAICYISDKFMLRTVFWTISLGCVVGLFIISA